MLKELQDSLAGLALRSEAIRMKYNGKAADMTATEEQEWNDILAEMEKIKARIETVRKAEVVDAWLKEGVNSVTRPSGGEPDHDKQARAGLAAFAKALRSDTRSLSPDELRALGYTTSVKAYQADNPAGGGFLVTPMTFANGLLSLMKDLVFMRGLATTFSINNAESLGVQAIDTDPNDADWTTEIATVTEDTAMEFGRRELKPNPVRKLVKLSNKLIRTAPNVEQVVQDRLAYKFAVTEEKAFLTGDGANKPLGVFTASPLGIPTSRDVAAANASSIVADDFLNVVFALKAQYRANSRWLLHRDIVKIARKLKDSQNNYIWATGLGPGQGLQGTPDTLCGRPVLESEYAPSTVTTGLYTGILGDFRYYYVADSLAMQIQVLNELYAANRQTGYILEKETDGMPVLGEAFARLKQA